MADEVTTEKQVTVVFESQIGEPDELDGNGNRNILLSGPIEVFALLDTFDDLGSTELRDMVLQYISEYNEIKGTENVIPSIVVFVADVTGLSKPESINDTDIHRGAYFRIYSGVTVNEIANNFSVHLWREVLLGTHSHSNPALLEKLGQAFKVNGETGKLETVEGGILDNQGKGDILSDLKELLPDEAKGILSQAKKYDDLIEPYRIEEHPLDAPLEEQGWLHTTGNCRDIYLELTKADKKLYLVKTEDGYGLSTKVTVKDEDGNETQIVPKGAVGWFRIFSQDVNFGKEEVEGAVKVAISQTDSKKYLLSYGLPWNINIDKDLAVLYVNGVSVDPDYYSLDPEKLLNKEASFELRKSGFNYSGVENFVLTVLCDAEISRSDLRELIDEKPGLLDEITTKLNRLFVEGEFNRRPEVPHYYLATDDTGTAYWENILNLTPQQTFQATTIKLTADDLAGYSEGSSVRVEFTGEHTVKYDPRVDYPLVIIDELIAVNTNMSSNANGELVCEFPYDKYIPSQLEDCEVKVTVVMIRTDVAGEISERLSKDYVSKKDAIDILSRGKLDLGDYATMAALAEFSKINHTHSQYATKNHNHDYRYANFDHTHPELLKAVSQIISEYSGADSGEVMAKLEELSSEEERKYTTLINGIFAAAGIEYDSDGNPYIPDSNIVLTDGVIAEINESLNENKLEPLPEGAHVSDALQTLAILFRKDNVRDDQVLLASPIPVRLKNGPVGGIDEAWVNENLENGILKTNTDLQYILKAIFNPYISAASVVSKLTPVADDIKLHWFVSDGNDGMIEVDPTHLNENDVGRKMYFSFEVLESGKKSVSVTDEVTGVVNDVKTVYSCEYAGGVFNENVPIDYFPDEPTITIHYTSNIPVTDNYGLAEDGVELNGYLEFIQEFSYDFSDYIIGYGKTLAKTPDELEVSFSRFVEEEEREIIVPVECPYIVVFVEIGLDEGKNSLISITDETSGDEVFHFFTELEGTYEHGDARYNVYYYEIMDDSEPVVIRIGAREVLNGK